jgi:hypothetical protein
VAVSPRVLKNAYVAVNGTAISQYCSAATVEAPFDELDVTTFGGNYKQFAQGLGDATITLTVFPDSTQVVNNIFWPLSQSGGTFEVKLREDAGAAAGTANWMYTMTGSLFNYNPIGGAVGEAMSTDIPIRNAGTAGLVRGTT